MSGLIFRKISALLLLCLLVTVQASAIFACGMSMVADGSDGWSYGNDSAEQSFIHFEDGVERLVISRTFENGSKDTVWIIPVPAHPESVKVDVLSDLPRYSGYDVVVRAKREMKTLAEGIVYSQIYPLLTLLFQRERTVFTASESISMMNSTSK